MTALKLKTVLGDHAHMRPLKAGDIRSDKVALEFVEFSPTNAAFKPMVREQKFDVCEMAIVTYLMAKAYNKPLVLLPAVMLGRFQHHCMLHNAERGALTPADLPGRKVGVRAYSQTTGAWLRGILQNDFGIDMRAVQWVTFEDAHVAEYREPAGVIRADGDMTAMLLAGELDAAIYGAELPDDPRLQSVIPDSQAAAQAWHRKHGVTPVNHRVVTTKALAASRPAVVRDVYEALAKAKQAAPVPAVDLTPFGIEANRPALEMIVDYTTQQGLIPDRPSVDDLFAEFNGVMAA